MIQKLDNADSEVAKHIFNVFQSAYKIEAQLIGVENFPPLSRSAHDIACSDTQFYGYFESTHLAAVIEITTSDTQLDIDSLTVAPNFFRKGMF